MADSRRELLLKAVQAALEVASVNWHSEVTTKPAGLNVHRYLTRSVDAGALPDLTVFYVGESLDAGLQAATDESRRSVRVGVRCRVKAGAGETGDEALDPVLVWAELAALTDYTLGGAAANARLEGVDAITAREYADTYAEATLQFEFTVLTKWGDPRQIP
jgi:hypothetical protein